MRFYHKIILDDNNIIYFMKISGEIVFTYNDEENARLVFDSLEVDNENYLESNVNGKSINYNVTNDKLGSFLATVDDLISSEIVVEKILNKTKSWKVLYK